MEACQRPLPSSGNKSKDEFYWEQLWGAPTELYWHIICVWHWWPGWSVLAPFDAALPSPYLPSFDPLKSTQFPGYRSINNIACHKVAIKPSATRQRNGNYHKRKRKCIRTHTHTPETTNDTDRQNDKQINRRNCSSTIDGPKTKRRQ